MSTARTVVITGAAGAIGSAIVKRFASNGDIVVATDVSQDALDARQSDWISSALVPLHTRAADISIETSVTELAEFAREHVRTVDVLVNCAAIFPLVPFEELTADGWKAVLDVNLTGTFFVVKAFLPLMKDGGKGRIVNIGSGTFFVGTQGHSAYVSSKGGILGLTRTLARELGQYGITVNQVTPGLTVTPHSVKHMPERVIAMQRELRALQRDELPEDVVGSVFFLASDDAAFITGQTINVDGGRHLL
jgi:NAD(P)-dependent dehydrogenase (short-subunit alcohol dehydrogenase family)